MYSNIRSRAGLVALVFALIISLVSAVPVPIPAPQSALSSTLSSRSAQSGTIPTVSPTTKALTGYSDPNDQPEDNQLVRRNKRLNAKKSPIFENGLKPLKHRNKPLNTRAGPKGGFRRPGIQGVKQAYYFPEY